MSNITLESKASRASAASQKNPVGLQARLRVITEHPRFQKLVIALILANAVVLALDCIPAVATAMGSSLFYADQVFVAIFAVEIALRMGALGPRFFRDPWNVFDFLVVAISLSSVAGLSALRAFRVFRILRLVSVFPKLRSVVAALLESIPGIASVGFILMIIVFVSSVIATQLFGEAFPLLFGDLFRSMFTLFKVMTLEGWPDIADEVIDKYPYAWIFFITYIMVATLTMLNLFVAIIVGAMEREAVEDNATKEGQDDMLRELQALRNAVERLEQRVETTDNRR